MRYIEIYDTTLRDGAQAEGVSFSLQDKILIARKMASLFFDYIEGGFPSSNEKDAQFFEEFKQSPLENSKLTAFGMTRRRETTAASDQGLQSLLAAGTKVITLVGKSSAFQATEVLKVDLDENLKMIAESITHLHKQGARVFFDAEHFFDGYKDNPEYSMKVLRCAKDAGAERLILCDTNGGTLPEEVSAIVRAIKNEIIDNEEKCGLGIHAHNDCGLAVANSLAAIDAGAVQVQGTINGFGERCGNANLITLIATLALKKNNLYKVLRPEILARLTELSRFLYEIMNERPRHNEPFVGMSAFAHKGGMHVSGVNRVSQAYEHIDPQLVGNERRILISELSGRSNIATRIANFKFNDPQISEKILAEVVRQENLGYQYEAAEASFQLLIKKVSGQYRSHFERLGYHVNIISDKNGSMNSEATIKIKIGDEEHLVVAEGDGPVNALDAAMRKALEPEFPCLRELKLVDYKVRVINSAAATAARVRVIIESSDHNELWSTVGAHENIIEASWIALCDSIEYKLSKKKN